MRKSVVIVSLGVVALGCAAFVAVPAWIQHKAIETAAARGVTLHIGSTRLAIDGVHFEDASATTVQMPNAKIHIDEMSSDWGATAIVIDGADVTVDGPASLPTPLPADNAVTITSSPPIHVQSAHISWTHIFGDVNADISNISGDYAFTAKSGDTYKWSGNTALLLSGRTIGPFATQFETDAASSYRVMLSSDADGPTPETWIGSFSPGYYAVDLSITSRPLSKIGVPLDLLGISVAADPTISLHLVDSIKRPNDAPPSANGLLALSVSPISITGLPAPAPVSVNLSWSGNPDQPMPLTQSTFAVDPFSGPVTGSVTRPSGAVAVNFVVASNAVPCSKFAASNPLQSGVMGAVAAMTGVKSDVVGDVKIAGALQFDSRNPGGRQLSLTPTTTCGLSISLGSGGK